MTATSGPLVHSLRLRALVMRTSIGGLNRHLRNDDKSNLQQWSQNSPIPSCPECRWRQSWPTFGVTTDVHNHLPVRAAPRPRHRDQPQSATRPARPRPGHRSRAIPPADRRRPPGRIQPAAERPSRPPRARPLTQHSRACRSHTPTCARIQAARPSPTGPAPLPAAPCLRAAVHQRSHGQ